MLSLLLDYAHMLLIFSWKDIVQLLCISYFVFKITAWLAYDSTKPLLLWGYSYISLLAVSYFLDLHLLYTLLIYAAPTAGALCIILHQKTLQKHFVSYKSKPITPATATHHDWLYTLVRTSMLAAHHGKSITCLIERNDSVDHFLETDFTLHAPIKNSLLQILLHSHYFHSSKLIWCNKKGHLVSINTTWSLEVETIIEHKTTNQPIWKQYSHAMCKKSDAIVFHISHQQQYPTILIGSEIITNITHEQMLDVLQKFLKTTTKNKKVYHANNASSQKQNHT